MSIRWQALIWANASTVHFCYQASCWMWIPVLRVVSHWHMSSHIFHINWPGSWSEIIPQICDTNPSTSIYSLAPSQNLVHTTSGNGLLPDDTKLLPEPIMTFHQWSVVVLNWSSKYQSPKGIWKFNYIIKIRSFTCLRGQWVNSNLKHLKCNPGSLYVLLTRAIWGTEPTSNRQINSRLWYLQSVSNGGTTVLHKVIEINLSE